MLIDKQHRDTTCEQSRDITKDPQRIRIIEDLLVARREAKERIFSLVNGQEESLAVLFKGELLSIDVELAGLGDYQIDLDERTRFPKSSFLLSRQHLDVSQWMMPGPKVYYMLDLRHLSVPNKFGFDHQVDWIMTHVGLLARKIGLKLVVRRGGDEIVIVEEDTDDGRDRVKQFVQGIRMLRGEAFADEDTQLADEYAAHRQVMRGVRANYERHCREGSPFSVSGFIEWALEAYPEALDGIKRAEKSDDDFSEEILCAISQWVNERDEMPDARMCGVDIIGVSLADKPLSPELLAYAETQCAEPLHCLKQSQDAKDVEILKLPLSSCPIPEKGREEEINRHSRMQSEIWELERLVYGLEQDIQRWEEDLPNDLQKLDRARKERLRLISELSWHRATDPSSGAIFRELYPLFLKGGKKYCLTNVDQQHFGVVNNSGDYGDGDRCLHKLFECAFGRAEEQLERVNGQDDKKRNFTIIRGAGGSFIINSDWGIDTGIAQTLTEDMRGYLEGMPEEMLQRMRLEVSERNAMQKKWNEMHGITDHSSVRLGTVEVQSKCFEALNNETVTRAISRVLTS